MAVRAQIDDGLRWELTLHGVRTLSDDLGAMGEWVGPRTGRNARSHGQKEDYVLRRVLVACSVAGALEYPVTVAAETDRPGRPDFVLSCPNGQSRGLEVTEAGAEDYQAWLTGTESTIDPGDGLVGDNPERQAAADFNQAWAHKVGKFDKGSYQGFPSGCDLAIYDNTETEPLTYLADVLHKLAPPRELLGRFRQVHIARGDRVVLDVFGNRRRDIDLSRHYDIDFAGWAFDQAARLRDGGVEGLDVEHLAEELESLGRSDRRALGSHIRNLLLHLFEMAIPARTSRR